MKKIIALLLVLVMCFALVACGGSGNTETPPSSEPTENNDGTTNDNTTNKDDTNDDNTTTEPKKIERGTITTSENPLLQILFQTLADEGWSYTFNEDGTCGDQVYWWIESDTENIIAVYICTDYEWKYQLYAAPFNDKVRVSYNIAFYMYDEFLAWQPGSFYDVDYPNT